MLHRRLPTCQHSKSIQPPRFQGWSQTFTCFCSSVMTFIMMQDLQEIIIGGDASVPNLKTFPQGVPEISHSWQWEWRGMKTWSLQPRLSSMHRRRKTDSLLMKCRTSAGHMQVCVCVCVCTHVMTSFMSLSARRSKWMSWRVRIRRAPLPWVQMTRWPLFLGTACQIHPWKMNFQKRCDDLQAWLSNVQENKRVGPHPARKNCRAALNSTAAVSTPKKLFWLLWNGRKKTLLNNLLCIRGGWGVNCRGSFGKHLPAVCDSFLSR